uniref:CG-1 domain-containing protein n=1 Tax=Caenorhabditis tropicalis TaxID=1561998 RepID=A0A1I7V1D6_9PELO
MQQPPPQTDEFPRIQLISTTDPHRLRPGAPAAIEYFPPYKNEWNTKADILSIILAANADSRSSVIKTESSPRPCSGAQFIYPRLDGSWFKNDGYIWRKRNNGRNIREDHLKLKVQGQTQVIEAKHVHSAIVPTFHRRVYFIPESSHVLVHYLNEKNDYKMADRAEEIAKCMINNNVFIPLQQLHEQLSPIFYQHTDQLVLEVNEHLRVKGVNLPTSPLPEPAPRELERRNSCSSAFRKGLSSAALRRQPSANSEIDANHIGTMLKRYGCNGNSSTVSPIFHSIQSHHPNHQAMESRSPSGDDDYQQMSVKSSTNVSTPASAFAEKMKIRSPPTAISEMTPTSCSLKGGQKLMIVGAYYKKVHDYKISFGRGKLVPATMIHPGVLSCIIPGSSRPETVQVRVFSNGQAVSTTADFTYEPPEHFQRDTDDKLMQIFEKIRIMACAFNAYSSIEATDVVKFFTNNNKTRTSITFVQFRDHFSSSSPVCPSELANELEIISEEMRTSRGKLLLETAEAMTRTRKSHGICCRVTPSRGLAQ